MSEPALQHVSRLLNVTFLEMVVLGAKDWMTVDC